MSALYIANVAVLLICAWALWIRRDTFGSRWDRPFTVGIIVFGTGVALDSPWRDVAAASYPLTGKFYLLNTLGHICFLAGGAVGMKGICMRLMPDAALRRLMRSRIIPLVATASVVMAVCVVASPATSSMPVGHLYLVRPDGWLVAYWIVMAATMLAVESVAIYGMIQLRREPDAIGVDAQIGAVVAGVAGGALIALAAATGAVRIPAVLVWTLSYVAIGGGAFAAALMWRHRVARMNGRGLSGDSDAAELR